MSVDPMAGPVHTIISVTGVKRAGIIRHGLWLTGAGALETSRVQEGQGCR